jgi:hypothetical protein
MLQFLKPERLDPYIGSCDGIALPVRAETIRTLRKHDGGPQALPPRSPRRLRPPRWRNRRGRRNV